MCNNYFLFLNIFFFLNYKRYENIYHRREKEFFPMKNDEVIVIII